MSVTQQGQHQGPQILNLPFVTGAANGGHEPKAAEFRPCSTASTDLQTAFHKNDIKLGQNSGQQMGVGMKFVIYKWVKKSSPNSVENELETQEREIQSYLDNFAPEDYQVIDGFTDLHNSHRPELEKAVIQSLHSGATLLVAHADCLDMKVSFLAKQSGLGNLTVKIAQKPNVGVRPRPIAKAAIPHASHQAPSNTHADQSDRPTSDMSLPLKSIADTVMPSTGAPDVWSLLHLYRKKTPSTPKSQQPTSFAAYGSESSCNPCHKTSKSNSVGLKAERKAIDPVRSQAVLVQVSIGHWMDTGNG